jgi:hypothetical protein
MAKWKLKIHDSLYPELDLNLHGITAPVYEPIWQGIRVSLSFKSFESTRRSVAVCQAYLDKAVEPLEFTRRLVRVRNLLGAIPLYDQRQDGDSVDVIQVAQTQFKKLIEDGSYYLEWDWNTARTQLPHMHANTYPMFKLMHQTLRHRAMRPGPKYALRYFLEMIDEVINAKD